MDADLLRRQRRQKAHLQFYIKLKAPFNVQKTLHFNSNIIHKFINNIQNMSHYIKT
ncbi:hypothetical protein VCHA50P416_310034 [Vibrio chagasii]|nr:hypothetical protein VCHA41O246_130154 [Vibrio chagasii]CAH7173090.1 hypothetical protein VCHA42P256_300018 [Vibrio chagasii]CAH7397881.1 hypothetical protein VCHA50P416_310034 [Vibrio chagasii]CAH7441422.1 hypothetical protein VCHA57P511_300042 [Vibrio chagasii]